MKSVKYFAWRRSVLCSWCFRAAYWPPASRSSKRRISLLDCLTLIMVPIHFLTTLINY